MNRQEALRVLQVAPGASLEVCEAAYRALAKKHHTDAGGTDTAAMVAINAAIEAIRTGGTGRASAGASATTDTEVWPVGKHSGRPVGDLPLGYLLWWIDNGETRYLLDIVTAELQRRRAS